MKYLYIPILIFVFLLPLKLDSNIIRTEAASAVTQYTVQTAEEYTRSLTIKYGEKYGVDPSVLFEVIRCETAGTFDPTIQSSCVFSNGVREESYGLAQIYLPVHPDISLEQATDPEFAVEFMAKNWAQHSSWWMCYTKNK